MKKDLIDTRKKNLTDFMAMKEYVPMKQKELAIMLQVPKADAESFGRLLAELEQEGRVIRTANGKYAPAKAMNTITGRLDVKDRGFAFLLPDDEDVKDVFIPQENLNGGMHNDLVMVRVTNSGGGGGRNRQEGEVAKILERANATVVGRFESDKHFGFVVPDASSIPGDIFIAKDQFNGAKNGHKVVAEIIRYPDKRRNAEGRIKEILGYPDEPGIAVASIIKAYELNEQFPEKVLAEAEKVESAVAVTEKLLKKRRDLRTQKMVTIDGEDAKDLDDAVSLELLPNGKYRLGVHIADVSHYVREGTALDKEAYKRGTSVYLADRVIPMLPRSLSNGICSLNQGVDRLAFSVTMDIDKNGHVESSDIFESIINVDRRMTYTDVYKILEEDDAELKAKYADFVADFQNMRTLAEILRKQRFVRGAIDFDFDEAKIVLDESGKVIEIKRYKNTIANKIIEEFMLACNETVAERFFWEGIPFVYRIHEEPDEEKIRALADFVFNFGYSLKMSRNINPKTIQNMLEHIKGRPEEKIIEKLTLRSMSKARYSSEQTVHFGLASQYYCHFTSPIRRYPDLIIHRLIKEFSANIVKPERESAIRDRLPDVAKTCSLRERGADEAERDVEDLKKAEFMKGKEGMEFDGVISNVTSFGIFVELPDTVEGLVHISSIDDDYYVFNPMQYCLTGERKKKVYKLGDPIRVRLVKSDVLLRKIDFAIANADDTDS